MRPRISITRTEESFSEKPYINNQVKAFSAYAISRWYRVILKEVSFGIFSIISVSKEENNFTIESKDKVLSLSKLSGYLVIVKIVKIRHSKGQISKKQS